MVHNSLFLHLSKSAMSTTGYAYALYIICGSDRHLKSDNLS
ncbi:hypothetical protein [Nostoc sp. LEGE 12450]|nr:hypothetical protein [Nostoc sp. LEGE 12450]